MAYSFTEQQTKFVFKHFTIGTSDECWEWQGNKTSKDGYGRKKINGRRYPAHRVVYEILVGPVPDELVLDHLCRNKICVNPNHLEPVTTVENITRGEAKGAYMLRTGYCQNGHEMTPENTNPSTGIKCRQCKNAHQRLWAKQKRLLTNVS